MLKRFLQGIIIVFVLIVLFIASVMSFMNFAPQFGQRPAGEDQARIAGSPHFDPEEKIFVNLMETSLDMNFSKGLETMKEYMFASSTTPPAPLPSRFENLDQRDSALHITWFGHSAVLMEIGQQRVLLDPMLGTNASPVSFFTGRFNYEQKIPLEEIKDIDAILISHDHYDHLDYPSILALNKVTKRFFVPLGVGSHLVHWGVDPSKIQELDWWDTVSFENLDMVFTPSRHFSGRGFSDRNSTLWGSWVVESAGQKVYFSGDSGYGPHFKEIGDKYGPFDFAMMECGQYNEKWDQIHMMPEETIQASLDLGTKIAMPIHWGAFQLAVHTWDDPVQRASAEAQTRGLPLITPEIGTRVSPATVDSQWWKNF